MRRAPLCDSTGEEGAYRGPERASRWPLFSSRISSGMEAWGTGEWTLPLTIDTRFCARFIVTVTAGGSHGSNPLSWAQEARGAEGAA